MPIQTHWYDDEHRVIVLHYEGNWSWEELGNNLRAMHELPDAAEGDLIILVDMSQTSVLPHGNVLMQGRAIFNQVPQNVSNVVFVLESRLIKSFVALVFEMMPSWHNRLQFARTLEEAQRLVEEATVKQATKAGTN